MTEQQLNEQLDIFNKFNRDLAILCIKHCAKHGNSEAMQHAAQHMENVQDQIDCVFGTLQKIINRSEETKNANLN